MSRNTDLGSLEAADLAQVVGGASAKPPSKKQVAELMKSLQSSLKDLASNRYPSNSSITQLSPFVVLRAHR